MCSATDNRVHTKVPLPNPLPSWGEGTDKRETDREFHYN